MIREFLQRIKEGEKTPARRPMSAVMWSWIGAFFGIYIVSVSNELVHVDMLNSVILA